MIVCRAGRTKKTCFLTRCCAKASHRYVSIVNGHGMTDEWENGNFPTIGAQVLFFLYNKHIIWCLSAEDRY